MTDAEPIRIGPRATFGTRFVAALIDGLMVGAASFVMVAGISSAAGQGIGLLLSLAYYTYLEGSPSGQTVGKRMMNIRVVDFDTGAPIGYGRAAIRWVARFVSTLPCLLGYFWMLWDPQKQTWHDKLAVTVVVPTSDYPVAAWPG